VLEGAGLFWTPPSVTAVRFPVLLPSQVQRQNTVTPLPLPGFQRALLRDRPDLFPDNGQSVSVDHFGFSIAVSEFQHTIPFSLCLAYNGVSGIVFHFGRNPNSRGKEKQSQK